MYRASALGGEVAYYTDSVEKIDHSRRGHPECTRDAAKRASVRPLSYELVPQGASHHLLAFGSLTRMAASGWAALHRR